MKLPIYIEKFVHRLGNTHTIRVVISNYLEQRMMLSNGGIRISPRELREELEAAGKKHQSDAGGRDYQDQRH